MDLIGDLKPTNNELYLEGYKGIKEAKGDQLKIFNWICLVLTAGLAAAIVVVQFVAENQVCLGQNLAMTLWIVLALHALTLFDSFSRISGLDDKLCGLFAHVFMFLY